MKKFLIIAMCVFCTLPVLAAENTVQEIKNEKTYASIDLNSQIKPDGSVEEQKIENKNSWFNININRNTYKFYIPGSDISESGAK